MATAVSRHRADVRVPRHGGAHRRGRPPRLPAPHRPRPRRRDPRGQHALREAVGDAPGRAAEHGHVARRHVGGGAPRAGVRPAADRPVGGGLGGVPADGRARRPARGERRRDGAGADRRSTGREPTGRDGGGDRAARRPATGGAGRPPGHRSALAGPRLLGRRGGPPRSARRRLGRPRRRGLAIARGRPVGCRRAGLVAPRPRRPPRRLVGARRRLHRPSLGTGGAGRPTTTSTAATSTRSTRAARPRSPTSRRRSSGGAARAAPTSALSRSRGSSPPRRSGATRRGAGSTRCSTATRSTTCPSSSRGPTGSALRQVGNDPFGPDPQPIRRVTRRPAVDRFWAADASVLDGVPGDVGAVPDRPGRGPIGAAWSFADHVAHLAGWFDEGARGARGASATGGPGGPMPPEGSTPSTTARSGGPRGTAPADLRERIRRQAGAGSERRSRRHERRRMARPRGLQLGVRGPPRPRPRPSRDGRAVGRPDRLAGAEVRSRRSTGERERGEQMHARTVRSTGFRRAAGGGDRWLTIERLVAVDAPREFRAPSARPGRRLHARGRGRPPDHVRPSAAGRPATSHGLGEGRRRSAVVAGRSTTRLRSR